MIDRKIILTYFHYFNIWYLNQISSCAKWNLCSIYLAYQYMKQCSSKKVRKLKPILKKHCIMYVKKIPHTGDTKSLEQWK